MRIFNPPSIMWITFIFFIAVQVDINYAGFDNQPKIRSELGNLVIESAVDANITIRLIGEGSLNINDHDISKILQGIDPSKPNIGSYRQMLDMQSDIDRIKSKLVGRNGLLQRVTRLENRTRLNRNGPQMNQRGLSRRMMRLENRLNTVTLKLTEDNCKDMPCRNGGTCIDLYDSFHCLCLRSWVGPTCELDVNECALFTGTDVGCQNGGLCINTVGGYMCQCKAGYVGMHCTIRNNDCSSASDYELCGHGKCINTNSDAVRPYTCICDAGWKANEINGMCSTDVDECADNKPHCSVDPNVVCINLPGSYMCGSCPTGYTGTGYYCNDVDECDVNNGGCSTNPMVLCINTKGSSRCGPCPYGFTGDGYTCVRSDTNSNNQNGIAVNGNCVANNICHPMATCNDISNRIVCTCPSGYVGTGIGPLGCTPVNPCASNPCANGGTCTPNGFSYICTCPPTTLPPRCFFPNDPCVSNPCQNGGSCRVIHTASGTPAYACNCRPPYTGFLCNRVARSCGGVLTALNGTISYPSQDLTNYENNKRCAWIIRTNESLVLNIEFTKFDLEQSDNCHYDFLQMHDGRSTAAHLVGRFCGNQLPKGGKIISTTNNFYLWFKSDNKTSATGFELKWESVVPTCSKMIEIETHGTLSSPGYPGHYPPNRDCSWVLKAPYGKRIALHFYSMQLESHTDCNADYLAVYSETDPIDRQLIGKFCNTSHPEPLTSPGNEILINFHSDSESSDVGFLLHYSVTEGVPGCGGVFTTVKGEITPPMESGNYVSNLDCEYLIKMKSGLQLEITFPLFELENEAVVDDCSFDSLSIYDGKSLHSPFIGKWCGVNKPPDITSTGSEILIVFKSDFSIGAKGFILRYKSICQKSFTEDNGIITSPGYPSDYDVIGCEYDIMAPQGNAIKLEFLDFSLEDTDTECGYDYVQVFDGIESNTSIVGKYCGSQKPPLIVSTINQLHLKFVADDSIESRGFKANYTFFSTMCGGIIRDTSVVIEPPKQTGGLEHGAYEHDVTCRWMLIAPPGKMIVLTFTKFDLERSYGAKCDADYVEVYDNSTKYAGIMGRYCNNITPPVLRSADNIMTIVFHSDSSEAFTGFAATWSAIDASSFCGGDYFTPSGVLRSPGWPQKYATDRSCVWKITVPHGQQIELIPKKFELEQSTGCIFDYLEIRNGGSENSTLIGRYCGSSQLPKIISFTNQLYIKFTSDLSEVFNGFEIEWESALTGCGGTVKNIYNGVITSPGYPEPYGMSADCTWHIIVNRGSSIIINITDMELEEHDSCGYDSLEIIDGSNLKGYLLKTCGTQSNIPALYTSSNEAMIRFITDKTGESRGFSLEFITNCSRELKDLYGIIESPNYPNDYPANLKCEWRIIAPKSNKIKLEFHDLRLESGSLMDDEDDNGRSCSYDYLDIDDYKRGTKVNSFKRCMPASPAYTSTGNELVIKFTTDESIGEPGFRIEYIMVGCGGELRYPNDTIASPNFPLNYPDDSECKWFITAPPGYSIELNITEYAFQTSKDCKDDGLQIQYVETQENITVICGETSTNHTVLTINSNKIGLTFYSNEQGNSRGFRATYKFVPIHCGGLFTMDHGVITTPNYPLNYGPNLHCEWIIEPQLSHSIAIHLDEVDVEETVGCRSDYLEIYNILTPDNLYKYCNKEINERDLIFDGTTKIVFKSDAQTEYKGFKLHYKSACGGRIEIGQPGIISYDATNSHSTNDVCIWTIAATDTTHHITLSVSSFDIGSTLPSSTVTVYDGERMSVELKKFISGGDHFLPVSSNGNALTIKLDSIFSNTKFKAYYSDYDNNCGGELYSLKGTLASPLYPRSYPLNTDCIWTISAAQGNIINLSFESFNLETSENCADDYLEIRENTSSGKLIGVFCGTDSPGSLPKVEKFWIKFHSDNEDVGSGFVMYYSYVQLSEISGDSGMILSPGYPDLYSLKTSIEWRITVRHSSKIHIKALEMYHLNTNGLEIYDGYDYTADKLGIILGPDEGLLTSSNVIYLRIPSSENLNKTTFWKFKLEWKKVAGDFELASTLENKTAMVCGRHKDIVVTSYISNFTSPVLKNYDDCEWIIKSGTEGMKPSLSLYFVDMEQDSSDSCMFNNIKIFKSRDLVSWTKLDEICRSSSYVSFEGDPYLKLNYNTGYVLGGGQSRNITGFKGFISLMCGGIFTSPSGMISYIGLTKNCTWEVKVRPGKRIKFTIDVIDLKMESNNVCNSFMQIRNGIDKESPILGKTQYCGNKVEEIPETSSNRAYITLEKTTQVFSLQRLKMSYQEVGDVCGAEITLSKDRNVSFVTPPGYPNAPNPHTECIWNINSLEGQLIRVDFIERFDFATSEDCTKEYFEIREGINKFAPLIGRYCKSNPGTLHIKSSHISIKYFTDVESPRTGSKIKLSLDRCGSYISGDTGIVTTTHYPKTGSFPNDKSCSYEIVGPENSRLNITFLDFDLPPNLEWEGEIDNFIQIYEIFPFGDGDGNETNRKFIGNYTSDNRPTNIISEVNRVVIELITSSVQYAYRGFLLSFSTTVMGCGGDLESPSGIIRPPVYQSVQRRPQYCTWRITVPKGKRVRVRLSDTQPLVRNTRSFIPPIPQVTTFGSLIMNMGTTLMFYNDFYHQSRITRINSNEMTKDMEVLSTDNKMLISGWGHNINSNNPYSLRYDSDLESVCTGNFNELSGQFQTYHEVGSIYYCEYKKHANVITPVIGTLSIDVVVSNFTASSCRLGPIAVQFFWTDTSGVGTTSIFNSICNQTHHQTVRTPFPNSKLVTLQRAWHDGMALNVTYKYHKCGGILKSNNDDSSMLTIESPDISAFQGGDKVECAWAIERSLDSLVNIDFQSLDLKGNCESEYVKIYNGLYPTSPLLIKLCSNEIPTTKILARPKLFIEYHSDSFNNKSAFKMSFNNFATCGGLLTNINIPIKNPGEKQYENNVECIWDVELDNGYHIGAEFVDRFYLEESVNCTKDYLEFFDDVNGDWKSIGRFCGRTHPAMVNSTSNKLRIKFKTDSQITADGFKLQLSRNCGGIYYATKNKQLLMSPGYPSYPPSIKCNYTIKASSDDVNIYLYFREFQLESRSYFSQLCGADNVTIWKFNKYSYTPDTLFNKIGLYCGDDKIEHLQAKGRVSVIFQSNSYIQKKGFILEYSLDSCGGDITTEGIIESPAILKTDLTRYDNEINCYWNITAPKNFGIRVRFNYLFIELYDDCMINHVEVYSGRGMNENNRLARLCGNITDHFPVVNVDNSTALIYLKTYGKYASEGIRAAISFVKHCDQTIKLNQTNGYKAFVDQTSSGYEPNMDCHYTIEAADGYQISASFRQFHVKDCAQILNRSSCGCDFLDIRDGSGPYSDLMGRFCGQSQPTPILSSGNSLYLRFFTDVNENDRGFLVDFEAKPTICGKSHHYLNASSSSVIISSPVTANGKYPPNTVCSWVIETSGYQKKLKLNFLLLDVVSDDDHLHCNNDYVEINDENVKSFVSYGFGKELIFSGTRQRTLESPFYLGTRSPVAPIHYCGNFEPNEILMPNKIQIKFRSDASNEARGFRLKVEHTNCVQNYTSLQGRISDTVGENDCTYYLQAPENYTISIYFNTISFSSDCTKLELQILNDKKEIQKTYCSYATNSPYFSDTNKLIIKTIRKVPAESIYYLYDHFDLLFVATKNGVGCGGDIFNYGGVITSPMYPDNSRDNTDCRWTIAVPKPLVIAVQFSAFDMGSSKTCANDFIELIEIDPTTRKETVVRRYCGEDQPAKFKSKYGFLVVRYKKTVNFQGTGWSLNFMGVQENAAVQDY